MSEAILFILLRTSIAVAVTAVVVTVALKWCRSSRIHRIAWAFVLLQGVLWTRIPMQPNVGCVKVRLRIWVKW